MSRHHAHRADSLIEVRSRDSIPDQFLWRSKLYRVVSVLEHWWESGAWWDTRVPAGAVIAAAAEAQRAGGTASDHEQATAQTMTLEDQEREFWRVEAGRGASSGSGVYDLCFDPARGQWSLSSVLD